MLPRALGVGVITIAVLSIGLYSTRSPSGPQSEPAARTDTPRVLSHGESKRPSTEPQSFMGLILPTHVLDVRGTSEGQLIELRTRVGRNVRKGDVLAILDTASVSREDVAVAELDLKLAEEELTRARLEVDQSKARLARARLLRDERLLSAEQYQEAEFGQRKAESLFESAGMLLEQRRRRLNQRRSIDANAQVTAPFDGVVSLEYVRQGDAVTRFEPIVRLVGIDSLRVRFAVPANVTAGTVVGGQVRVTVTEVNVVLAGTIDSIAPEVDSASQMVFVEATLRNPNSKNAGLVETLVGRPAAVVLLGSSER